MKAWAETLLHSRFVRIVIIGGIGFVVQTIVFETLAIYFGLISPSTATLLGGECGLLTNFALNERFSFRDRLTSAGNLAPRLLRFHLVVSGSLFIQWGVLFVTEHATANIFYIHIAYISGLLLGFISNYIGYHLFVWTRAENAA